MLTSSTTSLPAHLELHQSTNHPLYRPLKTCLNCLNYIKTVMILTHNILKQPHLCYINSEDNSDLQCQVWKLKHLSVITLLKHKEKKEKTSMFEHIKNGTALDLMNKAQMKRLSIGSYEQRKRKLHCVFSNIWWKLLEMQRRRSRFTELNCSTNEGKHEIILLYRWSNSENIYIFKWQITAVCCHRTEFLRPH